MIFSLIIMGVVILGVQVIFSLWYRKKAKVLKLFPKILIFVASSIAIILISYVLFAYCYSILAICDVKLDNNIQYLSTFDKKLQDVYDLHDEFYKNHPNLELPCSGIYLWDGSADSEDLISPEDRAYAIKVIQSKEFADLFQSYDVVFQYLIDNPNIQYVGTLSKVRGYTRHVGDFVYIYDEIGQSEKNLPLLLEARNKIEFLQQQESPFMVNSLVYRACMSILDVYIAKYASNDNKYLPIYQELLAEAKNRAIKITVERELSAQVVKDLMLLDYKKYNQVLFEHFILYPIALIHYSNWCIDSKKIIKYLDNQQIDKLKNSKSINLNAGYLSYQKAIKNKEKAIILFAIKIYRCENGKFPESLEELYPKYLDNKASDQFEYFIDGKNFVLIDPR